jgi:hypothetical protein
MSILSLTTSEQMELYKKETGVSQVNVFDFEYFVFMKSIEEIAE